VAVETKLSWFVAIVAVLNVLVVVEFVRRRKLAENFALLWIGVGVIGVLLSVGRHFVDSVAAKVGVYYGASLVFALGLLFLLFVCMSLSMHVSRLTDKAEILAEEVAILRAKLERDGPRGGAVAAGRVDVPPGRRGASLTSHDLAGHAD
jgi:hypothetical protein